MKAKLAMRLLADLLKWDSAKAAAEFSWLRLMVEAKYDHYQGYSPGARFYVNLLAWIGQFAEEDRSIAYRLIRDHLIFVCQGEMHHLVELSMPMIKEEMAKQVARELGIPYYKTWGMADADRRLQLMSMRTLYVGLSDGAKVDVFRRENEGIVSNEQIVAASEISDAKWRKLVKELKKRLKENGFVDEAASFERICLIDDFTASGTTLIRFDKEEGAWKGKIPTFCDQNKDRIGKGQAIEDQCWIHAHHYLATGKAISLSHDVIQAYTREMPSLRFVLTSSTTLSNDIVIDDSSDKGFSDFLKKYYDSSIEDDIVGKNIWYGYKEGGLPLVLYHNTPNNSLAVLWASSVGSRRKNNAPLMKPLFSRKKRHIGHG